MDEYVDKDPETRKLEAEATAALNRIIALIAKRDAGLIEIIQDDVLERLARGEEVRHVVVVRGALHESHLQKAVEDMNAAVLGGRSNGVGFNLIVHDPILPK
jgi:hypothetical protein